MFIRAKSIDNLVADDLQRHALEAAWIVRLPGIGLKTPVFIASQADPKATALRMPFNKSKKSTAEAQRHRDTEISQRTPKNVAFYF